jgi:hypothetical protein
VSAEPIETVLVKSAEAAPVEPTQIVPPESTSSEPSNAMPKMNARAKALDEKLRNLKERAKAAREAAIARPRELHSSIATGTTSPVSAPPPSALSEASSHVKPDEPLRFPTERIAKSSSPFLMGETRQYATRFRKGG